MMRRRRRSVCLFTRSSAEEPRWGEGTTDLGLGSCRVLGKCRSFWGPPGGRGLSSPVPWERGPPWPLPCRVTGPLRAAEMSLSFHVGPSHTWEGRGRPLNAW